MANLGKVSNVTEKGGAGGGMGSKVVNENAPYVLSRGPLTYDQHEASANRGQARDPGGNGHGRFRSEGGGR